MIQSQPDGYLAVPATGTGKPLLVLHAWWGLNDTLKAFCNRLAENGFVAFAPDLYHGKVATTIEDADTFSSALFGNLDMPTADAAAAAAYLRERAESVGGMAVIGFSLGAFFALDISMRMPQQIEKVVVFYGTHPGDFSSATASYLGHFAETDEYEPQAEVEKLEAALRQAGRPLTFYHYAGTGHWFFEPDRPDAYNAVAAALAWERTLAFLG